MISDWTNRRRVQLLDDFFVDGVPLPVVQLEDVRGVLESQSALGQFVLDVGRFPVGQLAHDHVGELDQLVAVLDAVRPEPE